MVYANTCSVSNKWTELEVVASAAEIVGLSETWLTKEVATSSLWLSDYVQYRVDRSDGRSGGGTLLLVRKHLRQREGPTLTTPNIQIAGCSVGTRHGWASVICVYRSPSATQDEDNEMLQTIESVTSNELVLILGDFNAPEIDWELEYAPENSFGESLLELIHRHALTQHVRQDTRWRLNQNPSLLDLIISRSENDINSVEIAAPLGKSDHGVLKAEFMVGGTSPPDKFRRNMKGLRSASLIEAARNKNWIASHGGVDEQWDLIKCNLVELLDTFAPMVRIRRRGTPPWWKARARKAHRSKSRAWGRYRRSGSHRRLLEFIRARNAANKVQLDCRHKYEERLAQGAKKNPKAYFNYVQAKSNVRVTVGNVRSVNGEYANTNGDKANILQKYFESVHLIDTGNQPSLDDRPNREPMRPIVFDEETVRRELAGLQVSKAAGPDGLCPAILKPLAEIIAAPVTRLFRTSLNDCHLPQDWKIAQVVPIHKGGNREDVNNYRPVSLTSVLLKVMERIVSRQMTSYLSDWALISPNQHGFFRRRSCTTNLLCFLEEVTKRIDRGEEVEVSYLDFRKAFDSVNHRLLIEKLRAYQINQTLVDWIAEFLKERSFYVEVEGQRSANGRIVSGVPQGSVLGPLLFLIYINDLTEVLENPHFMFADDVKIVGEARSTNIQGDLEKVSQWCEKWGLPLNGQKCKQLAKVESNSSPRTLGDAAHQVEVQNTEEMKDLGVMITADFKPQLQCMEAAKRANRALSQLQRTVISRNRKILVPLYSSYVRPHLEYAIQAWHPTLMRDKGVLEKVQKRFTKMIPELRELPYEERLSSLNLFSLDRRRTRGDLIETFRILKGMSDLGNVEMFQKNTDDRLRGHEWKLVKPRANTTMRANFFSHRVVNHWNNLPASVVASTSVRTFKLNLDAHWEVEQANQV